MLDRALHREPHGLDHHDLLEAERERASPANSCSQPCARRRSRRGARRPDARRRSPRRRPRSPSSRRGPAPRTPGRTRARRPGRRVDRRRADLGHAVAEWMSMRRSARRRPDARGRSVARADRRPRRRLQFAHALEVAERAFALEARAAGDVDPRDPAPAATAAACRRATTSRTARPAARRPPRRRASGPNRC